MKRRIAILGSTGSIGTQALEVIAAHPEAFETEVLTANSNAALLIEQAVKYQPNAVAICDESKYLHVKNSLAGYDIKVFAGYESIMQLMESDTIDMVLTAMVGFSGLEPTLAAIKSMSH